VSTESRPTTSGAQAQQARSVKTVLHLLRHGEVENPRGILYGRLPDYHLSDIGKRMAERIAHTLKGRDLTYLVSSPLERAQESARPTSEELGLEIVTDARVIEADNVFEGMKVGVGDGSLRKPSAWKHLYNPFKPSWGEPYKDVVVRMLAAMHDARDAAAGHEALIVSHQLPIWVVRSFVEGRRLFHDPRRRQCSLSSLTTFTYRDDKVVTVAYSEPAADLLPVRPVKKFTAGA
jgi:broad specificity phosphatase PhoE